MLIRVAKNITKFPAHVVQILTSTVIECQRAKLQKTCYEYAAMLMRPEYRNSVDPKYKKPIETFVRRPATEEVNERLTPCPYCQFELPETLLECPSCKNSIPYCVASGRHMVFHDWTNCPSCKFPALYSVFVERIRADGACAMCGKSVNLADVKRIEDPRPFLMKNEVDEKKAQQKGTGLSASAAAAAAAGGGGAAADVNPLDITPNFK
jgi:WD repeat-containing protein 19